MAKQAKINLFETAKSFSKPPAPRKAKAADVGIEGLEELAAFHNVINQMETISKVLENEVKFRIADHFLEDGTKKKTRPDNFNGVEGIGSGSCQLRLRSSRSALTDTEYALLDEYGIETEIIEDAPETFIINPKYATNNELLGKIANALAKVNGLPEDIILKQDGVSRRVVTEHGLSQIFSKAKSVAAKLFPVAGCIAIRLKWNGTTAQAFEKVQALVNDDATE